MLDVHCGDESFALLVKLVEALLVPATNQHVFTFVISRRSSCTEDVALCLPDHFLVVQGDLRRLGQLLRAGPVAHLLIQELLGCFELCLVQRQEL